MAELLDVSRQTVSKWENGLVQPNNKNIESLCEILKVTKKVLFNETACVSDENTHDSNNDNSISNRIDNYLLGIIVLSIIIIWMITLTALIGTIAFTTNISSLYRNSSSSKYVFYILLTVTLILILADIILFIVKLKNKDK